MEKITFSVANNVYRAVPNTIAEIFVMYPAPSLTGVLVMQYIQYCGRKGLACETIQHHS